MRLPAVQEEPQELGRGAHQRAQEWIQKQAPVALEAHQNHPQRVLEPPPGCLPAVPTWIVPALPLRSAFA
jgi:hypothetical protein